MRIEKAKADLLAATSGPGGRYWRYTPTISTMLAALERAERQIAELEARSLTVKLPDGYAVRLGHPINEDERGVMIPKADGDWLVLMLSTPSAPLASAGRRRFDRATAG